MDKATNLQTAPLMGSWEPNGYQDWLPSYWWRVVIMVGGVFISPLSAGLWRFCFCIYGTFARRQVLQKLEMHDRGAVQVMEDFCSLSVCSRDRDEEQEGDVFVSLVFCWSKTDVLYDAEMLFEVHRFCPKQGVELRCAAAVSLPASLLTCSRHEGGLALEEDSEDARATLPAGSCSSSLPTGRCCSSST